jgi:hypothetical protein
MAASLVSSALASGLQVGLAACGEHGVLVVAPNRGKRHRRDLLSVLSQLGLNQTVTAHHLMERAAEHRRAGTTLVLFTPRAGGAEAQPGRSVTFSPSQPGAQRLFRFPPDTDFSACIPSGLAHKLETSRLGGKVSAGASTVAA